MNNPKISAIVAISKNAVLGKNNDLIFRIPEDQKRFKELTNGHAVIMGRKTFESIGRILPNRSNIIITRDKKYQIDGAVICHSLEDAINKAREVEKDEIFIIGGGQIYQESMGIIDKLYLTIVDKTVEGDTFFPHYSAFKKVVYEEEKEFEGLKYKFIDLEK